MKIALQTASGNYVSAVNNGGLGDPEGLPYNSVPFHTNATAIKDWEKFKIIGFDDGTVAIQTHTGNYVTAVNEGGMGDPEGMPANSITFHTNATEINTSETFTLVPLDNDLIALQTASGNYVTAIKGGGMGDPEGKRFNSWPLHTNATEILDWEKFKIVIVEGPDDL